jgi:hypothetical protein
MRARVRLKDVVVHGKMLMLGRIRTDGLGSSGCGYSPAASSCENGDKPTVSISWPAGRAPAAENVLCYLELILKFHGEQISVSNSFCKLSIFNWNNPPPPNILFNVLHQTPNGQLRTQNKRYIKKHKYNNNNKQIIIIILCQITNNNNNSSIVYLSTCKQPEGQLQSKQGRIEEQNKY